MPKKKVLYRAGFDSLESEAFFEVSGNALRLITAWSYNDAHWRPEYMHGLIAYFGGDIRRLAPELIGKAEKILKEYWGF